MRYDRYEKEGDIHWRWFDDPLNGYRSLLLNSLKPILGKFGVVLEIGSGDGKASQIMTACGLRVIGVEPELAGNKIANERVKMVTIQDTLENFTCPYADFLFSLNTIEHVDKPELFRDIMKNIKEFGVIVTDNADVKTEKGKYHTKEFNMKELVDLFEGFRTEPIQLFTKQFIGLKVYA